MSTTFHVQCQLKRGTTHSTSWLPQKYANVGRFGKLRDDDGVWQDGWEVVVTGIVRPTDEVMERERASLPQRVASDV